MTSIKEAFSRFEKAEYNRRVRRAIENKQDPASVEPVKYLEEEKVLLCGMFPPIVKMDKDLTQLKDCVHLSLSTNNIEKIGAGLKELKKLKILSLGRNNIRKLEQLDIPGLEQLWISYNKIDKLTGLDKLKSLRVLFMSNNNVSSWGEIDRLANQCPELVDVLFFNNPIQTSSPSVQEYRVNLLMRMPKLNCIDGVPVYQFERDEADKRR